MWQVASALISQLARDCNFNLTNAQSTKVEHGESHLINLEVNSKTLGMRLQFWGGILAQCLTNCKTHGKDHKLAARLTKSSTATEAYTKFNANRQGKLLSTVYTQINRTNNVRKRKTNQKAEKLTPSKAESRHSS